MRAYFLHLLGIFGHGFAKSHALMPEHFGGFLRWDNRYLVLSAKSSVSVSKSSEHKNPLAVGLPNRGPALVSFTREHDTRPLDRHAIHHDNPSDLDEPATAQLPHQQNRD